MITLMELVRPVIWVSVFFGIIVVARNVIFNKALIFAPKTLSDGIISFFGAFFAFLFIRFSAWLSENNRNYGNHFNALVKIERSCGGPHGLDNGTALIRCNIGP